MEYLKKILEKKVTQYNCKDFIKDDPISFPHSFVDRRDVEIAAFLASIIAWGNRKMILTSGNKMLFGIMDGRPYDYVMNRKWNTLDGNINIHRTFFARDFIYMCRGLERIYIEYGSMERLFENKDVWSGIASLRKELALANGGEFSRHISNPEAQKGRQASACKRLHMMLRWLVRNDGIVDIGIWNKISPSNLMIPLDVHVARTARKLGLITRTQNNRKTVEELTEKLRLLSQADPIRYDFALFGVGVASDEFFETINDNNNGGFFTATATK